MPACPAGSPLTPRDHGTRGEGLPLPGMFLSSPPGDALNPEPPNVARVYDALIGGKDHYAADREAARALETAVPGAAQAARDNRAFLGRAVRFLAARHGISQFLDIGTGLPAGDHVHQVARKVIPGARVVYADNDPVVVAHARALLAGQPGIAAVTGDVRYPRDLLADPAVRGMLDFSRPVAALLIAVLHFVTDEDDPWSAVRHITDQLAPGSYLVISHVTGDEISEAAVRAASKVYESALASGVARSRSEISRFFDGTELVLPGLVDVARWRPGRPAAAGPASPALFCAGVGRKRERLS